MKRFNDLSITKKILILPVASAAILMSVAGYLVVRVGCIYTAAVLIIAVLLILAIVPLMAGVFIKPILKLSAATKEIMKGDLTVRAEAGSQDEIGELTKSFNRMVESLLQSRKELRSEKAYTEKIISSMADSMIVVSPEGMIRSMNKAALGLLGYQESELVGRPAKKIFRQEGSELDKYFQKIIEQGAVYNVGLTFFTKDGKDIPIDFSGAAIREGEKILGIVNVARDVRQIMAVIGELQKAKIELEGRGSDSIKMQRAMLHIMEDLQRITNQLKAANEELRKALNIKTAFTGMVSHELRTPLTTLKESISQLSEGMLGTLNDGQKKLLELSRKSIDRLARLINEVLDFQALQAGKMSFRMEYNDICEVAREIRDSMLIVARGKNLDLAMELDEALPKVRFDRDKISQVLSNLIGNAIRATEKGGITIAVAQGDGVIQVSVQDTGIGIKEEDMPKLFQQYEKLGIKSGGTGLGLAISLEIIEAHGGKIWAESVFGQGTTVRFVLPQ